MSHARLTRWTRSLGVVFALAFVSPLLAEPPQTGSLLGKVADAGGAAVSGATVTLTGEGAPKVQVTNAQGELKFLSLAPGTYGLQVERAGFATLEYPNIVISAGLNTSIEVQLEATTAPLFVFNSGVSHELKFGAGYREAEVQSISTWTTLGEPFGPYHRNPFLGDERVRAALEAGVKDDGSSVIGLWCSGGKGKYIELGNEPGYSYEIGPMFKIAGGLGFAFQEHRDNGKSFMRIGSVTDTCVLKGLTTLEGGYPDVLDRDQTAPDGYEIFDLAFARFGSGSSSIHFRQLRARHRKLELVPSVSWQFSVDGAYSLAPRLAESAEAGKVILGHAACQIPNDGCDRIRRAVHDIATGAVAAGSATEIKLLNGSEFIGLHLEAGPLGDSGVVFTWFDPSVPRITTGADFYSADGQWSFRVQDLFPAQGNVFGNGLRLGANTATVLGEKWQSGGTFQNFITVLPTEGLPPVPSPPVPVGPPGTYFTSSQIFPNLELTWTQDGGGQNLRAGAVAATGPGIFLQQWDLVQACIPSATTLCLGAGRFQVKATHVTSAGVGAATGYMLSNDTGYFTFFDAANVELLVKVLDGCGLGGKYWVFAGGLTNVRTIVTVTDMTTGEIVVIDNPANTPFKPYQNTAAFACGTAGTASAEALPETQEEREAFEVGDLEALFGHADAGAAAPASSPCAADATHLCLNGGRFEVSTVWLTQDGATGAGRAVPLPPPGGGPPDTGYFWFFADSNVETIVKVLAGCSLNDRYWVFAGGLTNIKVTTTVRDASTGAVKTYVNPQGKAFQPLQDTAAFETCP